MKDFVGGVVRTDDLDITNRSRRKSDCLPTLAFLVTHVHYAVPLQMIRRDVDVVGIRAIVAIPKQKADATDVIGLRELNYDRA